MKIKHAMILAAGIGKRMQPITFKTPKPLLIIDNKSLLERTITLMTDYGVEEIIVNIHHLGSQIEDHISSLQTKASIKISNEKDLLLDTGGGVKHGTRQFEDKPFFIINPDTLWRSNYLNEMESIEKIYFSEKKPILLLVKKELSLDKSFEGDFNIKDNLISKDKNNNFIFTGLQIMDKDSINLIDKKIFSMNDVWNKLISKKNLLGLESSQKFYHLNTLEMFKKISNLKIIDC